MTLHGYLFTGEWKEPIPTCKAIVCEPIAIVNGFYDTTSQGDGEPYFIGESIYYECIEGEFVFSEWTVFVGEVIQVSHVSDYVIYRI